MASSEKSKKLREDVRSQCSRARDIVALLFDRGTFDEALTYVRGRDNADDFEGVICGWGAINGRLCFAFIEDTAHIGGGIGEAHAKKICELYRKALSAGAPIIGCFDSRGAKINEGYGALKAYSQIISAVSDAKGEIPQIALIDGIAGGTTAVIASMFDVSVMTKASKLYVAPPSLIKEKFASDTGSAEFAAKSGSTAVLAEDTSSAAAEIKKILSCLPDTYCEEVEYSVPEDNADRLTPAVSALAEKHDIRGIINEISDTGSVCELYRDTDAGSVTSLIKINGISAVATGVAGRLTPAGAKKLLSAKLLAESFGIPVVSLLDCDGYEISASAESCDFAGTLAQLAFAWEAPAVSLVCGAAHATSFSLLASKEAGFDVVMALDCADIAPMSADAAVEFKYGDEIKSATDKKAIIEEKTALWRDEVSSPLVAARLGDVDDIIDCSEARQRIAAALEMLV